jgi:hypothetical protein
MMRERAAEGNLKFLFVNAAGLDPAIVRLKGNMPQGMTKESIR